jgi:hypothetical protein
MMTFPALSESLWAWHTLQIQPHAELLQACHDEYLGPMALQVAALCRC